MSFSSSMQQLQGLIRIYAAWRCKGLDKGLQTKQHNHNTSLTHLCQGFHTWYLLRYCSHSNYTTTGQTKAHYSVSFFNAVTLIHHYLTITKRCKVYLRKYYTFHTELVPLPIYATSTNGQICNLSIPKGKFVQDQAYQHLNSILSNIRKQWGQLHILEFLYFGAPTPFRI